MSAQLLIILVGIVLTGLAVVSSLGEKGAGAAETTSGATAG